MRMRLPLLALVACLFLAASPAGARERSIFVSQPYAAPGTAWYSIDLTSGALTKNGGMIDTAATPAVPGISPDGKTYYVPDYFNNFVRGFAIGSGGLTEVAGSPLATGAGPNASIVEPEGRYIWTADWTGGTITGFARAGDGSFSAPPGYPVATGGTPSTLAISPHHHFVYLPTHSGNTIAGFRRGDDGSMTPLAGFPLAHAKQPLDAEFSVDGRFLFIADEADDTVSSFAVDPMTGALVAVPGSPFAGPDQAVSLASSPNGRYLIAIGQGGGVWSMTIGQDGALSTITQTTAGNWPFDVTITPDGRFSYVANYNSGTLSGYRIADDGTLSELAGSPFGDVSGPMSSFAIVPNQGPVAALSASVNGDTASFDASGSTDPDGSPASYAWDFGDGQTSTSTAAVANHAYAAPGTYTATLTVTDDEGCSNALVGTGQTLYCNGGALAQIQRQVTIAEPDLPLLLSRASGRRLRIRRVRGRPVRRMRAYFTLSSSAKVRIRFMKRCRTRGCARHAPPRLHRKVRFRNFGSRVTINGRAGRNARSFTRRIGGRTLTRGTYRMRMYAFDTRGRRTKLVTTRRFVVR
jgi:6-phosphogluconolactonase (cycloisomerase 2 family)